MYHFLAHSLSWESSPFLLFHCVYEVPLNPFFIFPLVPKFVQILFFFSNDFLLAFPGFLYGCIFMGGPIVSPSTCQSLGLPPPPLIMGVGKSWTRHLKVGWGWGEESLFSSISFPWLGKCPRERALSVPGRR